jgi:2-oxo-4-hydroxy-4-carboxy-5-ureidoimidazoline decarboxylase
MTPSSTAKQPPFTLAAINAMDRPAFVSAFGAIFEHSPWVAEAAWAARPFASIDAMHAAMIAAVRGSDEAKLTALLCAHPELAGREAKQGQLTHSSDVEQASAGLTRLTPEEVRLIDTLNRAYRERHGFPFIACVRHYTKAGIHAELARRTARDTAPEREEALVQISFITRSRLAQVTDESQAFRAA